MHVIKQSTAFTDTVGPILDSTGAEYTGAVIGDLSISKNGTEAAMAAAATLTHISNGHYTLVGTTGNSDTLGRVVIRCNKSTYQMPPVRYEVLAATAFDTLVTNGTIASTTNITAATGIDVTKINGTSIAGTGTRVADGFVSLLNVASPVFTLASVNQTGNVYPLVDTEVASILAAIDTEIADIQSRLPAALVSGRMDSNMQAAATGVITASVIAADAITAAKIADGAIDRATFAADTGLQTIRSNTAQAGTTSTITLDASASATTQFYRWHLVYVTGGTGVGQCRLITSYDATTKVATVSPFFATAPNSSSTFAVLPAGSVNVEAMVQDTTAAAGLSGLGYTYADLGNIEANLVAMNGDFQSAIDLKDFADAGYDPATNKVQGVVLVDTTTVNTDMLTAAAVWAAATRTLTTQSDSSGVTTLLSRITGTQAAHTVSILSQTLPGSYTSGQLGYLIDQINRSLGPFVGTGTNQVHGWLRAIMRGDLSVPSDVGGSYAPSTHSLEGNAGLLQSAVTAIGSDVDALILAVDVIDNLLDTEFPALVTTVESLWTTALTESYAADGATVTPAQALYELLAHMGEVAITGTTKRLNKRDGSTLAANFTLDSAGTPTAITHA